MFEIIGLTVALLIATASTFFAAGLLGLASGALVLRPLARAIAGRAKSDGGAQ